MEVLGRADAELHGSAAGVEFDAQGSLLFMGGTEGGAPHGSTGTAGLGADPREGERGVVWGRMVGVWVKQAKCKANLEKKLRRGRGREQEKGEKGKVGQMIAGMYFIGPI